MKEVMNQTKRVGDRCDKHHFLQLVGLGILVFWAIYQPVFPRLNSTYYIAGLGTISLFLFGKVADIRKTREGKLTGILICLEVYLVAVVLLFKGDITLLKQPIHVFFSLLYVYGLKMYGHSCDVTKDEMREVIINTGLIQSAICVLMCISIPLREINWKYIISTVADPEQKAYFESIAVFRYYGVAGINQYLSSIGTVSALLFLFSLFYSIELQSKILFIKALILLIPTILDARTGVVCAFIGAIVLLLYYLRDNWKKNVQRILKAGAGILAWMLVAYKVIQNEYFHVFTTVKETIAPDEHRAAKEWSSQTVTAIKDLAVQNTTSKEYEWYGGLLPSNWAIPHGIRFFVGEGRIPEIVYQPGDMIGRTDAGFARLICVGGIILLVLQLIALFETVKIKKDSKRERPLIYAILACFLAAEMKGSVYLQTAVIMVILLILHCVMDDVV